jgi:SsrA-binding protein
MPGAAFGHEPKRARKLLLHAREIEEIDRAIARNGMTVAAVRLYFKDGRVKVELALARGKKTLDKREAMKEKDAEREARVAMARGRRGD